MRPTSARYGVVMTRFLLILTLALPVLAGWGGDDRTSTGDFVADANRICREGAAKIQEVTREQQEAAGELESLERQRQAVATTSSARREAYEPYMERLRALKPPSDLEENWTSFLDGIARLRPDPGAGRRHALGRPGQARRAVRGVHADRARDATVRGGQPARRLPARSGLGPGQPHPAAQAGRIAAMGGRRDSCRMHHWTALEAERAFTAASRHSPPGRGRHPCAPVRAHGVRPPRL